ncbi:MAG: metallophosphoesterase [Ferruginibacter sp.]|nr:metallophosphoesterase [Ferruginibacter sp.]
MAAFWFQIFIKKQTRLAAISFINKQWFQYLQRGTFVIFFKQLIVKHRNNFFYWLLIGSIAAGCFFTKSASGQSQVYRHILLHGKVLTAAGKPLANIAVTDGTSIVSTNAKGIYTIPSSNEAMFVYITVPAGYEIPMKNYMAFFYQEIKAVNGVFKADFILSKLQQDDTRHSTIVWADPQINNKEEADMLLATAVPDTRELAKELSAKGPVQGIAAGDLSWDAPPIIPAYKKAIAETGIPFYQVLGNHDMDINVRTDEQSDSTFKKSMGPTWYSFNRGRAHYVVLDNIFYYSDGYNYMGYITEKQFRWLEQDLQRIRPGSLVFVSMHISAYTEEKKRQHAKEDNPGSITVNRKYLYALLKPFKAHMLTGHTHYNENFIEAGVYQHIHAAVCGTWWISKLCGDGTPRGYGVYEINGDSLSWYYKSIGYDKNYQMRLYSRGVYKNKPADVAANVWNYDSEWRVVWYEDGILKGDMRRETDFDAAEQAFLTGPERPAKYPWAQPLLTDHLFFATPSATAKNIRIVVTDRFGRQYNQEMVLKN